jgi:hypothetical protein
MNQRRIIWLSALLFDLILFFYLIPIDVYDRYEMFFSFLGAGIFVVCLFQVLGDFESLHEPFEKADPGVPVDPLRKLAPFSVIPGFILIFVLVFHHSGRKEKELAAYGVLTKGKVTGGQSTTTTRRLQSNTSYDIRVIYFDSLQRQHYFKEDVSSSEFNDLYEGATIDVVYSKRYPALAAAVLSVEELSKFKKIPQEEIAIDHLLAILEEKVKQDSLLGYLNSISYEWTASDEAGYYTNEKKEIAINVSPDRNQLAYVQKTNLLAVDSAGFEASLVKQGFMKKASSVDGETKEFYYNDKYVISKQRKMSEMTENSFAMNVFDVFQVAKIESLEE